MAKLEIPLDMNPNLIAALEKVSAYAGRLEAERDALAAKLSNVISAWNRHDYDAINAEINKTPQQCLAEIKAEAGRAGYLQALADTEHRIDGFYATTEEEDNTAADQYADKIRKGEL